jgi:prepilin-type N-terminal cleavage/methylation domain-containing protein
MRRRTGFTLVELLVAMALIIFIMAILSEAFAAGFKSFRDLRALGQMNERLRTASSELRKYLQADHFEGRKRLSDANFWADGPPREGFLKIIQVGPSNLEGAANGIPSFNANNHGLHFAAKLRGNSRGDFFPASYLGASFSPSLTGLAFLGDPQKVDAYRDLNSTFHAQWVEVAVFLRPTELAVSESGTTPGQLYALYLRTKAIIPQPVSGLEIPVGRNDLPILADFSLFDTTPGGAGNIYANTPSDITNPARRMQWATRADGVFRPVTLGEENPARAGSDVLLTDVLSFNVRVLVNGATDFVDLNDLNSVFPQNAVTGAGPAIFDTYTQSSQTWLGLKDYGSAMLGNPPQPNPDNWINSIPRYANITAGQPPIRIRGIQLQLRIWDVKTEQTRQVTLIVDL